MNTDKKAKKKKRMEQKNAVNNEKCKISIQKKKYSLPVFMDELLA